MSCAGAIAAQYEELATSTKLGLSKVCTLIALFYLYGVNILSRWVVDYTLMCLNEHGIVRVTHCVFRNLAKVTAS